MNFNTIFLKSFRVLLLPLALIYGLIIYIRNWMFDKKYLKSAQFNFPLICVGNLSVGGTGKSPMVEYLVELLKPKFKLGTLSRGYKRRTKGYALANQFTTALEIGDEPMQFHSKFPDIAVASCEERLVGIPHLLQDVPDLQAIILDDAFQHRSVNAGLNIVLTEYSNLYSHDFFFTHRRPARSMELGEKGAGDHRYKMPVRPGCGKQTKNNPFLKTGSGPENIFHHHRIRIALSYF
jgi:tetraacyldisaccharide 4'-kinase